MQDVPQTSPASTGANMETPAAFEALLVQLLPSAYGYAYRLTRNRADAEDLMQEAALRACRGAQSFEPGTHFKAWFFRIIIRCFWEKHRSALRRPQTVDFDDTPDLYLYKQMRQTGVSAAHADPMGELLDRMGTERVVAAIAVLPEEYGAVATLYFMEDFAYHEIAHVLGIPVGTVRSRLHRARKMLQKSLWRIAVDAGLIADMQRGDA
ncbi:MAG: sigma-70 family RNA polymerase sigma factor [Gemmatimonadota bacterium]|nr:sigma-70 family RNA polymerase sigma factor [Gemmatimonadota bacterium]